MSLVTIFASQFPVFLSMRSTFSILEGFAVIGLVALALTVTIVAGEIDLSIGSVAALSGVIVVQLMEPLGPVLAILAAVTAGLLIGLLQGYLVYRLQIQAIVLTIGTLVLFRGLSLVAAGEKTVSLTDFETSDFIQTRLLVFSPASLLVIALFVGVGLFLKFNHYAREIYAVGGARREALAAGVPLMRPMMITFALSGTCAGLVGVIVALRSGSAQPLGLQDLLLAGVTAAFVGGAHVMGGRGSAAGAAIGGLTIQILTNGMNFYLAPAYVVGLALGVLLMVVVLFQLVSDLVERQKTGRTRRAAMHHR
ncbi:ABC transporter permease [Mesorhizobium sp.]|uniref:ABC transporter permease n=1 Tax=Mesorhizobium sp. TaxID=1871066 RepID=UPI00257DF152|nr:ABC transporter permease [Mesorhizobium sp.]